MFAIIALSIILSGYIVIEFSTYHFIRLHRFDGQLLYLKTTAIGFFIFLLALIIFGLIDFNPILKRIDINDALLPNKVILVKELILLSILSLFLAIIFAILTELWFMRKVYVLSGKTIDLCKLRKKTKIFLMYKLLSDSPLDQILFESFVQEKFLLITMRDRKCYVGRVASLGEPNEKDGPDQEILLVPISSGYRDKDTLELTLTTSYDFPEKTINKTLLIVLKQHDIISACEFHEELYRRVSK
ncbi:hypothetical protein ACD661_04670 [Legionella lytica]|uniref:Transmembrane protein n=1 Tax=Legionella lytica TaxID=96232 RepID=A0ABW8D589_9GAMM